MAINIAFYRNVGECFKDTPNIFSLFDISLESLVVAASKRAKIKYLFLYLYIYNDVIIEKNILNIMSCMYTDMRQYLRFIKEKKLFCNISTPSNNPFIICTEDNISNIEIFRYLIETDDIVLIFGEKDLVKGLIESREVYPIGDMCVVPLNLPIKNGNYWISENRIDTFTQLGDSPFYTKNNRYIVDLENPRTYLPELPEVIDIDFLDNITRSYTFYMPEEFLWKNPPMKRTKINILNPPPVRNFIKSLIEKINFYKCIPSIYISAEDYKHIFDQLTLIPGNIKPEIHIIIDHYKQAKDIIKLLQFSGNFLSKEITFCFIPETFNFNLEFDYLSQIITYDLRGLNIEFIIDTDKPFFLEENQLLTLSDDNHIKVDPAFYDVYSHLILNNLQLKNRYSLNREKGFSMYINAPSNCAFASNSRIDTCGKPHHILLNESLKDAFKDIRSNLKLKNFD